MPHSPPPAFKMIDRMRQDAPLNKPNRAGFGKGRTVHGAQNREQPIRVAVLDGAPLFGEGVSHVLSQAVEVEIVLRTTEVEELCSAVNGRTCDLIICDGSTVRGAEGVRLGSSLNERPEVRLIVLVENGDELKANGFPLRGHAFVILPRTTTPAELLAEVRAGSAMLASGTQASVSVSPEQAAPSTLFGLSVRELEIVRLLAEGLRAREVGEQLEISHKTVSSHKQRVMKKLELERHSELIQWALGNGWSNAGLTVSHRGVKG